MTGMNRDIGPSVEEVLKQARSMSEDPGVREIEKQEFLKKWKAAKQAEKDQQERERKQAALRQYLDLRAGVYLDHTGGAPTQTQLEQWTEEFISAQVRRAQEEKEARLSESIEENYDFGEEANN